ALGPRFGVDVGGGPTRARGGARETRTPACDIFECLLGLKTGRREQRFAQLEIVLTAAALGLGVCGTRTALAAVTEPNGQVVPGPPNTASETTLQQYFDAQGEAVKAVNQASVVPGTFSPLCDFQATLVLSQSGAQAGSAWHNHT